MSRLDEIEQEINYLESQIKLLEIELLQRKINNKLDEMIKKMS